MNPGKSPPSKPVNRPVDAKDMPPPTGIAREVLLSLDAKGVIRTASQSCQHVFGYTPIELTGRRLVDYIVPEQQEALRRLLADATSRHESILSTKTGFITGDYSSVLIDISFHIVYDANNIPDQIQCSLINLHGLAAVQSTTGDKGEQYAALIAGSPDIFFTITSDGRFEDANPAFCTAISLQPGDLIGKTLWDIFDKKEADRYFAIIKDVFDTGMTKVMEDSITTANGIRIYSTTITGLKDSSGIVRTAFLTARDITGRVEAEQLLQQKSDEMERYFASSLDLWCIADTDGSFIRLSSEWEKVLGYQMDELIGKRFLDFIHPDDVASTIAAVSDLRDQQPVLSFVNRYRCKDRTYRWIEWRSMPHGRLIYAAARDITDRIRAEDALRSSEERYRALYENSAVAIAIFSPEGYYLDCNNAYSEMMGYKVEELRQLNVASITHPDDVILSSGNISDIATGVVDSNRYLKRNIRRDGEVVWCDVCNRPLRDPQGLITAIIAAVVDITERRKAEEALRSSEEKHRILIDNSQDIIFMLSTEGIITFASPAWTTLLGYSVAEVIGTSYEQFIHPEDLHICQSFLKNVVSKDLHAPSIEYRTRHKDGSWRWHTSNGVPLRDQSGNIIGYEGIARDVTQRKLAEDALRQSEKKYRQLIELANEGIWSVDENDLTTFVNPRMAKILGCEPDQMLGRSLLDFIYGEEDHSPEQWLQTIRQAREQGESSSYEQRFRRADGTAVWCFVSSTPIFDDDGRFAGSFGMLTDISERKRAEAALESRLIALTRPLAEDVRISVDELFNLEDIQRLQDQFSQATGVASIITQPDGTPITAPSNFCHLCNNIIRKTEIGRANCFKSDAVLGRFHPEGPIVQQCLSGGLWDAGASITVGGHHIANWLIGQVRDESQTEEHMRAYAREIGADEEEFVDAFNQVTPMSLQQFENVAKALFTVASQLSTMAYQNIQQARFITERRQAEHALSESEQKFRELFESAPIGVFRTTSTGKVLSINPTMAYILGFTSTQEAMRHYTDLGAQLYVHAERRAEFIQQLLSTGRVENFDYEGYTVDKKIIWLTMSARIAQRNSDGSFIIDGFTWDITQRKRAEEAKEKLEDQLRQAQKMESVGRLAGGVAHDFNNMLGVIIGYADLVLDQLSQTDPLYGQLELIRKSAERSADLTRQLLAFARKQTIAPVPLDLNRTVTGMLAMLKRLIGEDTELVWLPDDEIWTVKIDPSQVDQVLANLLVNARDAIEGNGRVTIETHNVVLDEHFCIEHTAFKPGEYVMLVVSDNGRGMDRETQAMIFEPFFTTKALGEGTGLGLATVYGAIAQNDGYINVYSEIGFGTTFKIYLPRFVGHTAATAAGEAAAAALGSMETILLVEDEPAILSMSKTMLERLGYRVLAAASPAEALRLAHEHAGQIHLLMTDVVMPELSGRDLAKRLINLYPEMKRLFMSGYTADTIARHGILYEGTNFIQKPFSMKDLAGKLREVLAD